MKNRSFILVTLVIVCALAGWYIYVSSQASGARSVQEVSIDWWGSAHADASAEAFTHWNEDDPSEVPVNCAKCHSGDGFLDYLGQDGSTAMVVDDPAEGNSVISCEVCHNEQADVLQTAVFPFRRRDHPRQRRRAMRHLPQRNQRRRERQTGHTGSQ